jgi:hypothetical protein
VGAADLPPPTESRRAAMVSFQDLDDHPPSAVASPNRFERVAVSGICAA